MVAGEQRQDLFDYRNFLLFNKTQKGKKLISNPVYYI